MDPSTRTSSAMSGANPDSPDLSGKMLGDFRLLRQLGQGGMGQVYLAEQISLKRKVAVKIMRPDVAVSATSYQRFRAEAEAIARITHANIVQVYAFGEEAGLHYMALEYVEGRNLRDYLAKKGPPEIPLALSIMRQVAAALQRASELGIIHRDIKPENILLTRRGEVKVADFGLSRCYADDQPAVNLTQPGLTMGTPLYMSPEQIQGQPLDPRTDIYSFGITCYHMLAGQPPFRGQTSLELAIQHVKTEPKPLQEFRPDLPAELCAIVHKMMAKNQDRRYQSCADLLKEIARVRESIGVSKTQAGLTAENLGAAQSTASNMVLLPVLPSRWLLGVAAATILVALIGGGAFAWMRNRSRLQAERQPPAAKLGEFPPPLTEEQKQEKFMRDAVEQLRNPTSAPRPQFGLQLAVDLGVFYVKHNRFEEADQFFLDLRERPPQHMEALRTLGRLGHAIILARTNKTAESNKAFRELLDESKGRPGLPFLLNQQPQLRAEIGRALDYNKINAGPGQPFPQQLEAYRRPPESLSLQQGSPRRGEKKGK